MNILAICSALNNSYIALNYEGKIYSEILKSDENYHSLYLIKKIKELLKNNSISFNSLQAITINCGPGSFTGIRVAMTVAKIIAGELNIPLIPLDTAQILLNTYNCDLLVMDARRDMYFLGNKEEIQLVSKDKVKEKISNKTILCDKRCKEFFTNPICYEEQEKDIGQTMLNLALDKYNQTNNKDEFNYLNVKANYIQTPPIF